MIENLVNEGFGIETDLAAVQSQPELAAGVYERLLQTKLKASYQKEFGKSFSWYGNVETILACAKSAGMPVVSFPKTPNGHYLPTLAQRIANYADKLVEHTGLVDSLEKRHQAVAIRYSPRHAVDKEYAYAARCADEFANLGLILGITSGDQIPLYVLNTITTQVEKIL
ncbi:hypothetical protein HY008_00245 [Candidatus Woesebacteria bacterium]|nr:hypothetical protein [Candidatus Woesebacteria bacterium]